MPAGCEHCRAVGKGCRAGRCLWSLHFRATTRTNCLQGVSSVCRRRRADGRNSRRDCPRRGRVAAGAASARVRAAIARPVNCAGVLMPPVHRTQAHSCGRGRAVAAMAALREPALDARSPLLASTPASLAFGDDEGVSVSVRSTGSVGSGSRVGGVLRRDSKRGIVATAAAVGGAAAVPTSYKCRARARADMQSRMRGGVTAHARARAPRCGLPLALMPSRR